MPFFNGTIAFDDEFRSFFLDFFYPGHLTLPSLSLMSFFIVIDGTLAIRFK
jgi:hypothetical protein